MTDQPQSRIVLVVDDDAWMRKLIGRMVAALGFEPLLAADGSEAIHLFAAHSQEIVAATLDLEMPTTNGREVLAMMSEVAPTLPVVICTGRELEDAVLPGRAPGSPGVVYLKKPFLQEHLKQALERAISETGTR